MKTMTKRGLVQLVLKLVLLWFIVGGVLNLAGRLAGVSYLVLPIIDGTPDNWNRLLIQTISFFVTSVLWLCVGYFLWKNEKRFVRGILPFYDEEASDQRLSTDDVLRLIIVSLGICTLAAGIGEMILTKMSIKEFFQPVFQSSFSREIRIHGALSPVLKFILGLAMILTPNFLQWCIRSMQRDGPANEADLEGVSR